MLRANDLIVGAFGAAILAALRQDCPGCTITFAPETDEEPSNDLREGRVDLYLAHRTTCAPKSASRACFPPGSAPLCAPIIPFWPKGSRRPRSYGTSISVSRAGGGCTGRSTLCCASVSAWRRRVVMVVPTYYAMVETLRMTDMILPLPGIAIDYLPIRSMHLAEFEFPFDLPPVRSFQAWHPRRDSDPVHRWLRNTVYRVVRQRGDDLPEGFSPTMSVAGEKDNVIRPYWP